VTKKRNTFNEGIHGDKLYQKRARQALPILVAYAKQRECVTYLELAKKLNMSNERNLNFVLGAIGNSLNNLSTKIKLRIPIINFLVLNKKTGLPGDGVFDFWLTSKNKFNELPSSKQFEMLEKCHKEIFLFDKWDIVLANLELNKYDFYEPDHNIEAILEGGSKEHVAKIMKRNPKARIECLAHYGDKCQICDFSFNDEYGNIGKGYIQVHHLEPLSEKKEEYIINPVKDMIPVCANCHVMLHRKTPPYTIEKLKRIMYGDRKSCC
jgi:hypothetical protein